MIDTSKGFEGYLQKYRFRVAIPYLNGDVMDFGGNEGEMGKFVKGNYVVVNYDHSVMEGKMFDTVVMLAVIEHIEYQEVFKILKNISEKHLKSGGKVVLTTPTKIAMPILECMAFLGMVGRENIDEHKHYWSKKEMYELAEKSGLKVLKYRKFQGGVNQMAVFEKN